MRRRSALASLRVGQIRPLNQAAIVLTIGGHWWPAARNANH
jgi:hypothetical protein